MIGKSGQRESSLHIALEYLGLGNYTFTIFASEITSTCLDEEATGA